MSESGRGHRQLAVGVAAVAGAGLAAYYGYARWKAGKLRWTAGKDKTAAEQKTEQKPANNEVETEEPKEKAAKEVPAAESKGDAASVQASSQNNVFSREISRDSDLSISGTFEKLNLPSQGEDVSKSALTESFEKVSLPSSPSKTSSPSAKAPLPASTSSTAGVPTGPGTQGSSSPAAATPAIQKGTASPVQSGTGTSDTKEPAKAATANQASPAAAKPTPAASSPPAASSVPAPATVSPAPAASSPAPVASPPAPAASSPAPATSPVKPPASPPQVAQPKPAPTPSPPAPKAAPPSPAPAATATPTAAAKPTSPAVAPLVAADLKITEDEDEEEDDEEEEDKEDAEDSDVSVESQPESDSPKPPGLVEITVTPAQEEVTGQSDSSDDSANSRDDNDIVVIERSVDMTTSQSMQSSLGEETSEWDRYSLISGYSTKEMDDLGPSDRVPGQPSVKEAWTELSCQLAATVHSPALNGGPLDLGMTVCSTLCDLETDHFEHVLDHVTADSPAADMGLKGGEQLLQLNGMWTTHWLPDVLLQTIATLDVHSFDMLLKIPKDKSAIYRKLSVKGTMENGRLRCKPVVEDKSQAPKPREPMVLRSPVPRDCWLEHPASRKFILPQGDHLVAAVRDGAELAESFTMRRVLFPCKQPTDAPLRGRHSYQSPVSAMVFGVGDHAQYVAALGPSSLALLKHDRLRHIIRKLKTTDCRFFKHRFTAGLDFFESSELPDHYMACDGHKLYMKHAATVAEVAKDTELLFKVHYFLSN